MSIQAFFHCKQCLQRGMRDRIAVGMSDPQTIEVHCDACDSPVGSFKLAKALPPMVCGTCQKPIGPDHKH